MDFDQRLKALLDFMKLAPAKLLAFALGIFGGMSGNPAFPKPPVSMKALSDQIETYKTCIGKTSDGSRSAIAERDRQGKELKSMLRALAGYVEFCCPHDEDTFRTSGFVPASLTRNHPAPLNDSIRKVVHGDVSGTLKVRAVAVAGANSYELRWAPRLPDGSLGEWTTKSFGNTKRFIVISGLTRGTLYFFQVRALIDSEFTDWSDSVTKMCV